MFNRRSTFWGLTASLSLLVLPGAVHAAPFDPFAFTPLVTAFPTTGGTFFVNSALPTPTLTGPGGFSVMGVISNGVAVFTFSNISNVGASTFSGSGTRPVALLSQSNITLQNLTVTFNGGPGTTAGSQPPGGPGGPGGGAGGTGNTSDSNLVGDGQGPGGGEGFFAGGGGGFGGRGGDGAQFGGGSNFGGTPYGNLSTTLQGGSGGGGSVAAGGGGGGGGIAFIAASTLNLSNVTISANGGDGNPFNNGSGAGSGGGIFLSGASVALSGVNLNARGGRGRGSAFAPGGGGGGGRVLVEYGSGGITGSPTINVTGGLGGNQNDNGTLISPGNTSTTTPGSAGVSQIVNVATAAPEPASVVLLLSGGLLGFGRRRRRVSLPL